ncbi:uncharacterized protein JCM6883_007589 [Sporobolomyces salmoneus]|uniref:uncharacterized protein n=1 Tax=Sporobolomyces salmoneus TaxID=183962 RepID=UPI00316E91D3
MLSNWWPSRRDPTTPQPHVYFTARKSTKPPLKRQLRYSGFIVRLPSTPLPVAPHLISAWDLLSRPFERGRIVEHHLSTRSSNKTAVRAGYDKAEVKFGEWNQLSPHEFRKFYRKVIRDPSLKVPSTPQQRCVVNTEGDVKDTMLTNVILPAISVLNELIHPELRNDLVIVSSSELPTTGNLFNATTFESFSSSIAFDHGLILVDKRTFDLGWPPKIVVILVIVEEKRVPFVNAWEWREGVLESEEPNLMKLHLPQILMYCEQFHCERFLLSDAKQSVSIHAEVSTNESLALALRTWIRSAHLDSTHCDIWGFSPTNELLFLMGFDSICLDTLPIAYVIYSLKDKPNL